MRRILLLIVIVLCIITCNRCQGQSLTPIMDNLEIDYMLGEKLNFMAWKARQLDSFVIQQNEEVSKLTRLVEVGTLALNKMEEQYKTTESILGNYKTENTILLSNNTVYRERLQDCEGQVKQLENNLERVTRVKNQGFIVNGFLMVGLGIATYAILKS